MKRFSLAFAVVLACALGTAVHALPQAKPDPAQKDKVPVNVAGKWAMALETSMGTSTPSLELKQDGAKISGTYTGRYGSFPLEGTVAGRALAFSFSMSAEGQSVAMTFQGEVAADGLSMKGTATLGEMGEAAWTAKKLQ
jgi:hypothetical protein